jgi:23S rRNA (adenine2503-C2)-methyltransferase
MARLFDHTLTSLEHYLRSTHNLPSFHAKNVFKAIASSGAPSYAGITTLPQGIRDALSSQLPFNSAKVLEEVTSQDGTRKFLLGLPSATRKDLSVETVLIPHKAGGRRRDRLTLCVSSQAGCSLACSFCATGEKGFTANLTAADIIDQVLATGLPRPTNVVFMGQGEPLLNWKSVQASIGVLCSPHGFAMPPRRVTVSTSGVAPAISRVAVDTPGVRLALSLHAPNDTLRSKLMGINNQYPLKVVFAALEDFVRLRLEGLKGGGGEEEDEEEDDEEEETGEGASGSPPPGQRYNGTRRVRISFEYLLLGGINSSPAQATELAHLLSTWTRHALLHSHVNLIPFNAWKGAPSEYLPPSPECIADFAGILRQRGLSTTVRTPRGVEVGGACGMLAEAKRNPKRRLIQGNMYKYA